jgi:hypothetical protein
MGVVLDHVGTDVGGRIIDVKRATADYEVRETSKDDEFTEGGHDGEVDCVDESEKRM